VLPSELLLMHGQATTNGEREGERRGSKTKGE
jgi:hypothetical protein